MHHKVKRFSLNITNSTTESQLQNLVFMMTGLLFFTLFHQYKTLSA